MPYNDRSGVLFDHRDAPPATDKKLIVTLQCKRGPGQSQRGRLHHAHRTEILRHVKLRAAGRQFDDQAAEYLQAEAHRFEADSVEWRVF
jgi:hypothetical protein